MNPNQLRDQFVSTLNPNSIFNVPFKHDIQRNPLIRYQEKKETQSCKMKIQATKEDKGRFLSLVSKPKKGLKRSKSNKKVLQKKSQSVILGGTKQTMRLTTKTQSSLRNSHCKSCTNLEHTNQNSSSKVLNNEEIRNDNFFTQRNIPMNLITQPHENNTQLTRIISHKLKLDAVQPHQFITHKLLKTGEEESRLMANKERLLRNMSTGSMDRVFFSVGGERKEISPRKQMGTLKAEITLLTPSFQKPEMKNQRKRRQGAGFIRSASVRKSSPFNEKNSILNENKRITEFSYVQKGQPQASIQPLKKGQDIDKCITKMSMIRKEINELQSMIHQRLQQSQVRTKLMYNSQTLRQNDMNEMRKQQDDRLLYTSRGNKFDGSVKNMMLESHVATIVNDLNGLTRSLCNSSKSALGESIKTQQRLNMNNLQNNNSRQFGAPQKQPLLSSTNNNVMNLGEICNLIKYPESISQQLLQKQYVGPILNQNVNSQFKNMKNNQQNLIITNRFSLQQNHHNANRIR